MNNKTHFLFQDYVLNVEQTHDTASQLYHTIDEFRNSNNGFFDTDSDYRDHIVGKLKFFIDLYCKAAMILHINETVVLDNYYQMFKVLSQGYDDYYLSRIDEHYREYIIEQIKDVFDVIDDNMMTDNDDVINFITNTSHLNCQEQAFIIDCYYATIKSYKIMRLVDGEYQDETNYYGFRRTIAINDYCNKYNCDSNDLLVREIYDTTNTTKYSALDFYNYLCQYDIDLDFVRDYEDAKTIKEWLQYTIDTLFELNNDLIALEDFETVKHNITIIQQLRNIKQGA